MTIERNARIFRLLPTETKEVRYFGRPEVRHGLEALYPYSTTTVMGLDTIRTDDYTIDPDTDFLKVSKSHTFTGAEINKPENVDYISLHSPNALNRALGYEITYMWKPTPTVEKPQK